MNQENTASGAEEASKKSKKQEGRHCRNVDVHATAEQLTNRHKIRMEQKKKFREYMHRRFTEQPVFHTANLSRNHPDYGLSFSDHLVEKEARKSEKSS